MDCVISSVKEIGKCMWDSFLKPHVDYWWCFDSNIEAHGIGIQDLERKKHSVEQEIESARLRLEVVRPEVEEWLKESTDKLEEARKILLPDDNIPKAWCIRSRYSLGKNAKETAEEITQLLNKGKFERIADPAPPPAMASPPHRSTMEFESRKGVEEAIIKSLKESSVDVIGICGMGGVGKTTMARRIWKRVKDENLFHEVVMVVVSQKINIPKIQNEIAGSLKLQLDELKFDESNMSVRVHQLHTRLMDNNKKLIILDDIWESLEFQELGIPIDSNSERCKVLLTSRSSGTCNTITNKKVFELKTLEKEEAWNLFTEKAGKCIEDSDLLRLAKDVEQECKGLPIALVTVGLALQGETNIRVWKNSLSQLRKSNPTDLPEVIEKVYQPLKLSYDKLDRVVDKWFFLLCCLFPEDYNIPVEQLTLYGMGLQMFDNIGSIEEARDKAHTLVRKLKKRYLLIDGRDELHVKMHDVIRDVAIYILKSLSSVKNSSDVNCNWMSVDISNKQMEVPVLSPKLQLLMMWREWRSKAFYDISCLSFVGMEDFKVLSFEDISIGSLPTTLESLTHLQTLRLRDCVVENISVIGKLTSLKILSCYRCENIRELPAEIRRLKDLRLLELSGCYLLQRIPFGVISSLRLLEELKMRRSFSRWEAEENGKERRNASVREVECLPNLSCLEIEIEDCTLSAQEIDCNVVKYYIRIGQLRSSVKHYFEKFEERDCEKVMILNLGSDIGAVGKWIQKLVRNTEGLFLEGDGCVSNNFNIAEIKNLRNLMVVECSKLNTLFSSVCNPKDVSFCNLKSIRIVGCSNLKHLFSVATTTLSQLEVLEIKYCEKLEEVFWNGVRADNTDGCIEFPMLKELTLLSLPNLNIVFPVDVSFPNLKSIEIRQCHNLRYLFSVSVARRCLLQLKVLHIDIVSCEKFEEAFWKGIRDNNSDGCIEFPKLKEVTLYDLPNLTAFWQGLENIIIKFPNLTKMGIQGMSIQGMGIGGLNSLFPLNSEIVDDHTTSSFHFLCNPKVEMRCLKVLSIRNLGYDIRNICCHQIPNNIFNNLETLFICGMRGILSLMSTSIAKNLVSLKCLEIWSCKEMVEVIERDDDDKQVVDHINRLFPNLRELEMFNLCKLKRFWQWNHALELPLLEDVEINYCPMIETFTLGSINTPNLRKIEINYETIDDQKDLNDIVRHFWTEARQRQDQEQNEDTNKIEDECINENVTDESKDECSNENVNKDEI